MSVRQATKLQKILSAPPSAVAGAGQTGCKSFETLAFESVGRPLRRRLVGPLIRQPPRGVADEQTSPGPGIITGEIKMIELIIMVCSSFSREISCIAREWT
jgi:hypothetical protein